MRATVTNDRLALHPSTVLVAVALLISPPLYAERPSARIFGNYAGAGQCPPGSEKTCTDTGVMDNIFIQRVKEKVETEEDILIRELGGKKKVDARIAIRILRDYGRSCTLEGDMFWSGDYLEFQDEPTPHGAVPSNCRLQLWFKRGNVVIEDPGNECAEGFCFYGESITLVGRRFKKGPDPLLAAYKKSTTPPPAAIFGTYNGTGECATDERKTGICRENKISDYIVIKFSKTADARVVLGRWKDTADNSDYFCLRDVDAMWLGNHLTFIKETPNSPGRPHLLEFWFKGDTVVVRNIWDNHCGTYIQGAYFKKISTPLSRDTKH